MTEPLARCWYMMAFEEEGHRCPNPAPWGWPSAPDAPSGFVARSRWCDEHRHSQDIKVVDDCGPSGP